VNEKEGVSMGLSARALLGGWNTTSISSAHEELFSRATLSQ